MTSRQHTTAAQVSRAEYRKQLGRIFQKAMMAGDAVYEETKRLAFKRQLDLNSLEKEVHALCQDAAGVEAKRILSVYNSTLH